MARRPITVTCEICGRRFEGRRRRESVHCPECAEDIRRKGLGPIQVKKGISANQLCNSARPKELRWDQAEADLVCYLERFNRFRVCDGVTPRDLDHITEEDRQLANQIAARISAKTWAQITAPNASIARIGDWDLLNMSDFEWQNSKRILREVLTPLLMYSGIGVSRLTKALHRKRPKLIPICDSVVQSALGISAGNKCDRIITCMEKFRIAGQRHISRLQKLREVSRRLQAEMTELRILELLYWVRFGPFPRTSKHN